jgi:hypothetical protein
MKHRVSIIMFAVVFGSAVAISAAPATNSADWLPVDQDVWTIMMGEPQAHLLAAQEDLSNKDAKGAAAEIRRADTFLKIQEKRLAVASKQLSELAKDIASGKVISAKEVADTSNRAISALDHQQALVPVMAGVDTLFEDEANHHLAQAKNRLSKKDNKTAAGDIRKAEAYLKLKAVHASEKTKSELLSSAAELETLAKKVEDGTVTAAKDTEEAFARARKAVRSVL